tara:strand:+ start:399 stop:1325 length:927 start_codon:yes stop_codon:yes gene_type:complete
MNIEDVEKLSTIFGIFGFGAVVGGGILFYFLKSYIPAYLSKKGQNLATKQDIGAITDQVEAVKTGYAQILEEVKVSNQLKMSAIEREQSLKKEVYMEAVEAISQSQIMVANFSNLNITGHAITSEFSVQAGKIAKVQIVGTKETVEALIIFMGEVNTACLHLMLERAELVTRMKTIETLETLRNNHQSEIERYVSIMKDMNLAGKLDKGTMDYINRSVEFESNRSDEHVAKIDELSDVQKKEHLLYVKECMDTFFRISRCLPKVILSIRKELGLDISDEEYMYIFNLHINKGEIVFENFLSKLQTEIV